MNMQNYRSFETVTPLSEFFLEKLDIVISLFSL